MYLNTYHERSRLSGLCREDEYTCILETWVLKTYVISRTTERPSLALAHATRNRTPTCTYLVYDLVTRTCCGEYVLKT